MNTRSIRSATTLVLLIVAGSLAACGAAHLPATGEGDLGDRFVASRAAAPAALDEILVQATRLPADPINTDLEEVVVTATRLSDGMSAGNHDLEEIVVSATHLPSRVDPASGDAQVAALLD
jgi:hypothetical protein